MQTLVAPFERKILFISLAGMLFFGSIDSLRSIVTPLIQEDLNLTYLELSGAFSLGSFGYLAGSFLGGLLVDNRGLKLVTLWGGLLIAAGMLLYMCVENYCLFAVGFILAGIGGGVLEIGINGAVPAISESIEDQARYFNWLHGFYGVGASGLPLLGILILQRFPDWRNGFWLELALLGFILAFVICFRYGQVTTKRRVSDRKAMRIVSAEGSIKLAGLLFAIMVYVMAEVGFATWLPTYLVQVRHLPLTEGALYLSGFYLVFTAGRLSAHWWINRIGQEKAVMVSSILAVLIVGAAILWTDQATLPLLVVAGICFAAIFPTIAAIACHLYADRAGKVLGYLFTASGVGALVSNGLIGVVANAYGIETAFSLIIGFLACVFVIMFAVIRSNVRQSTNG
ncbi:MFS transporter [Brevibacillus choshinensis]|uniref:MFS transporter n=1 Tax=Brevibacillus choshinensis TaxID=54911 RepID=A0ABX7FTA6_BRECH|nr:MFS transporter [Brevibacillus choshinensis]QRG68877.1 MFS transporter [Brevibacillus choshinensis]